MAVMLSAKSERPSKLFRDVLRFTKLTDNATTPVRNSKYSAGYDIYSAYDYNIGAGQRELVLTDLQLHIPDGFYGQLTTRSGIQSSLKSEIINVGDGIVKGDYRGNIGVVLLNNSTTSTAHIMAYEIIAQLILKKIIDLQVVELTQLEI